MKQVSYNYHPQFIFRVPQLSLNKNILSEDELFVYSHQPLFKEAIYLASPVLYDELIKWHKGEFTEGKELDKLTISLYKYYVRMQSRCTPYGLFAACSTGKWNDKSEIIIDNSIHRHTRLDMNYLCALAQELKTHVIVQSLIRFYPNNSIYVFGNTIRYFEYKYVNNNRMHQISSVDNTDYLQLILKATELGATITDLAQLLVSEEVSYEEAKNFIIELINNQILVSELEPAVTGDEFISQVIQTLKNINLNSSYLEVETFILTLESIQQQIIKIDEQLGNDIECYRTIYTQLKSLNIPIVENQLFQTDLYKKSVSDSLDKLMQRKLITVVEFLNKLTPLSENENIKTFRDSFYAQYEEAEIPLLDALDTETGIGYLGKDKFGINVFLDDILIEEPRLPQDLKWSKHQKFLHKHLVKALNKNDYTVIFNDEDIKEIDNTSIMLPDSLSIMFKMIDENKILLQSCGGSSAVNLLGRFAHGDQNIHRMVSDIALHEEKTDSDIILAEIVHLPESRVGNILLRPAIRKYEIPYLAKSILPIANRIPLQDIFVSIKNNKIVLRSKKLNKEIIPRLSTAHNYSFNALPVYQFLCDLQTQNYEKNGFGFNWGVLSNDYKFLPRAEYKNVILLRAKWQLLKIDFQILLENKVEDYFLNIQNWRNSWNMPLLVVLTDGDNELLIDFNNPLSIKMFINTIKNRDEIIIEEFLFDVNNLFVKDHLGDGYTNEVIAIMLKDSIKEKQQLIPEIIIQQDGEINSIERDFCIGSEWLYYKLYCGVKTADKLLPKVIKPLSEELFTKKLTDKFFFIRFDDPDPHIRLRFHLTNINAIGKVINIITDYINPLQKEGLFTKIQTDTYKRELERYGNNLIEFSESVFCIDSIATLDILDLIEGEEGEQLRWQMALRSVDDLLRNFRFTREQKLSLLENMKENFIKEHGGNKELKLQLDTKFRSVRKHVENILDRNNDANREILPLINVLELKFTQMEFISEKILTIYNCNQSQVDINDLLASYIHMMLNRIFKSKQRTYEMVIYDLLYKHYKSILGREKIVRTALDTSIQE